MKEDRRRLGALNPEPEGGAGWPDTDAGRRARAQVDARLDSTALDLQPAPAPRMRLALMIGAPALVILLAVGLPLLFLRGRDTLDLPMPLATTVPQASTITSEPAATTTAAVGAAEWVFQGPVLDKQGVGPQLCSYMLDSLPPQCQGVPVAGFDWADIPWAESAGDTTWAEARLVGTFDGETFTLTRPPAEPEPAEAIDEDYFVTPCPEPPGGWVVTDPVLATEEAFEAARMYAEAQADYSALWIDYLVDPSEGIDLGPATFVLNVQFTGDLAGHEAALRAMYGGPLCVTQGIRSQAELEAILPGIEVALNSAEARAAGIFGPVSGYAADTLRGVVVAQVFLVTEGGQAWADQRWGAGLVEVHGMLVPYTAGEEDGFPLHLYVSNQSTEIDPVAVRITVDGQVVVDQDFAALGLHNWILFELELTPGEHEVRAIAPDADAELVETFVVEDEQWAVIDFWFWTGPEDSQAPRFTWVIQDQPIHFL
ncbi:MAG TPA: hypothetical protein VMX37_06730 [Acidimicrobiia bacterium]|nr:hypothetical protein [Acidimicrobiia bacterium]